MCTPPVRKRHFGRKCNFSPAGESGTQGIRSQGGPQKITRILIQFLSRKSVPPELHWAARNHPESAQGAQKLSKSSTLRALGVTFGHQIGESGPSREHRYLQRGGALRILLVSGLRILTSS